jgi:BirA family biotin operon repressor/biotin-[acetyl-CoA-carboxylase] ligase
MRSTPAEPPLDAALTAELARALAAGPAGSRRRGPVRAFRSVGSTQSVARAWALDGAPAGAVVVAEHQTAGRGRRGRSWAAPRGAALLCSVILRPALPVARWPEVMLAAGCAVAEAIEATAGVPTALKWPNDVLARGRKLAGILAEGLAGVDPVIVLGVGVNIAQGEGDWPAELADRAISLAMLGAMVSRGALLAGLLDRLAAWDAALAARGLDAVRDAWASRVAPGQPVPGLPGAVAVDLAPGGSLIVALPDGTRRVLGVDALAVEAPPETGGSLAAAGSRPGGAPPGVA